MSHDKHLRCSFCGKSKDSVRKFISGPSVYICNECIALCNEILAEDEEREVAEAITQVPTPQEIKDTLAYLRLVINPHDDVSLRRVINTPARGIGKTVLDTLERVELSDGEADIPLLTAGLQPIASARSLWARLVHAVDRRLLPTRSATSVKTFRDLIASLASDAATATVSTTITQML